MSVDNCRLFVGGIPKRINKDEIREEMDKVTEGVVDVIVYPSASDKSKNRGFAFVEYESHRVAAMARRKLMNGRVQLWGHQIAVDWAEPELEVDEEIMAHVSTREEERNNMVIGWAFLLSNCSPVVSTLLKEHVYLVYVKKMLLLGTGTLYMTALYLKKNI